MNDLGRIKTLAFPWGKAKVKIQLEARSYDKFDILSKKRRISFVHQEKSSTELKCNAPALAPAPSWRVIYTVYNGFVLQVAPHLYMYNDITFLSVGKQIAIPI